MNICFNFSFIAMFRMQPRVVESRVAQPYVVQSHIVQRKYHEHQKLHGEYARACYNHAVDYIENPDAMKHDKILELGMRRMIAHECAAKVLKTAVDNHVIDPRDYHSDVFKFIDLHRQKGLEKPEVYLAYDRMMKKIGNRE